MQVCVFPQICLVNPPVGAKGSIFEQWVSFIQILLNRVALTNFTMSSDNSVKKYHQILSLALKTFN